MASRDQSKQRKLELLSKLSSQRSSITAKKQVLNEQIAESKEVLSSQLKDKVNVSKIVGSKVKSSFTNSPNKWFLGSVLGGLVLSKLVFRKKHTPKTSSSVVEAAVGAGISSIFRTPKKRRQTNGIFYSPREVYYEEDYLEHPDPPNTNSGPYY